MTAAGLAPCHPVTVVDESGALQETHIAGERPLTLYLDKREVVTLMTLGGHPELLAIGYLRNQGLVEHLHDIVAVQVDWETESAAVVTSGTVADLDRRLGTRTVTTGCGQGTVFGHILDRLEAIELPAVQLRQSVIYDLLHALAQHNEVYRQAGAVHGCALCDRKNILMFVEDVGRHNAVDAIAGQMWLEDIDGSDKVFYTTGRLTSEMVIKVAQMGIPVLLSRSGVTQMGLELARKMGVTMIARAKGAHFLVFNGQQNVILDAPPQRSAARPPNNP
ncbi:MAG: formate dehydrogenase accessory sulfurtransferase FdhD [Gammaproteobacteria bacterium]